MSEYDRPIARIRKSVSAFVLVLIACHARSVAEGERDVRFLPAMELSCLSCHECIEPTKDAPCLKGCPRVHDNEDCPETVVLGKLSNLYEPVLFDHKQHAEMNEMGGGCSVCHHYNESEEILSCQECHGDKPNPQNLNQPGLRGAYHRQCLSCHEEWSHDTACGECHAPKQTGAEETEVRGTANLLGKPKFKATTTTTYAYNTNHATQSMVTFHHADHIEVFGLDCVQCHSGESCGRCHDENQRTINASHDLRTDCAGCHKDEVEKNCAFCHGSDRRDRFDHAERSGFDLRKYHHSLDCDRCHDRGMVFSGLDGNCVSCHPNDWQPEAFDHARTGIRLDELHLELDCVDCHVQGLGHPTDCTDCHDEEPDPFETILGGTSSAAIEMGKASIF